MKVNNPVNNAKNEIFNKKLKKSLEIASKEFEKNIGKNNFIVYGPRDTTSKRI